VTADYSNEVIIQGQYNGTLVTVAVDEDGNLRALLTGDFEGAPTTLNCDSAGNLKVGLVGEFEGSPAPVAVDEDGKIQTAFDMPIAYRYQGVLKEAPTVAGQVVLPAPGAGWAHLIHAYSLFVEATSPGTYSRVFLGPGGPSAKVRGTASLTTENVVDWELPPNTALMLYRESDSDTLGSVFLTHALVAVNTIGLIWTDLGQQYAQTYIQSLVSLGGGIVLAGTHPDGKILRSTDYGTTWTDLGQQYAQTHIQSLVSLGGGIVLAGTATGGKILRSTDYGTTWTDLGQQYAQTYVWSLVSLGGGIVLAGTHPDGKILRSTDYGTTWTDLGQQYAQTYILSLVSLGGGIVLAGTAAGGKILRSVEVE